MNINKWLSVFGEGVDKKIIKEHVTSQGNYLWHIFTWGNVPCLEGDEARRAFDALEYDEVFKVTGGCSKKIKSTSTVGKLSSEEIDNDSASDVYIVSKNYSWTYVRTHEKDLCGPYFCVKNNA